jgi:hypothetical protein
MLLVVDVKATTRVRGWVVFGDEGVICSEGCGHGRVVVERQFCQIFSCTDRGGAEVD